jgi:hypothetical protein
MVNGGTVNSAIDPSIALKNEDAFRGLLELVESARELGYEETPDGARLYGRVPHLGSHAWLHQLYPGLTSAELDSLVERIQRPIPPNYAWWLSRTNGMTLFSGALEFCGLVRVHSRSLDNRQPYDLFLEGEVQRRVLKAAPETFFFGTTGVGRGSRFYLETRTGTTHRCSRDSATPLQSWSSIADLVSIETPRLATIFDATGRSTVDRQLIWGN